MDSDFQTHYLSAEEAFGAGDFQKARSIVLELLNQLEQVPDAGQEREALLAWRAFVALLAGNIHLYGLGEPELAGRYFELVLASNPQETLKELAIQGLTQNKSPQGQEIQPQAASDPAANVRPNIGSSELIRDPFLQQQSTVIRSDQPTTTAYATPWLNNTPPTQPDADNEGHLDPPVEPEYGIPRETEPVAAHPEVDTKPALDTENLERDKDTDRSQAVREAILQRLENSRITVTLPVGSKAPSASNRSDDPASDRWSWLRKALRRS